ILQGFVASGEVSFAVCAADNVPPQFVFCRSHCAPIADIRPFFCLVPLPPSFALPNVSFVFRLLAISSGDVSSSFLSLSSSVSSPPKSSMPSSTTIQAVCKDSSRVEKSVPQFALLTTFLRNLCSVALAALPSPMFIHSSTSCLCLHRSLFQRFFLILFSAYSDLSRISYGGVEQFEKIQPLTTEEAMYSITRSLQ
ncbi:hypothetical protein S245_055955, partial [Arachis hypogaea]